MAFAFEKLLAYQKSVDFGDEICRQTEQFPRGYGFLVDQINSAALSIAANFVEGNGQFTKPDRRNFFEIDGGSVQVWVPLLELASRRKIGTIVTSLRMLKRRLPERVAVNSRFRESKRPMHTGDKHAIFPQSPSGW